MRKTTLAASTIIIAALGSLILLYLIRTHSIGQTEPSIIRELNATAADRERELTAIYVSHRIPEPLAALTAHIDRIENDIVELSNALTKEPSLSQTEEKAVRSAILEKENASRTALDTNRLFLDKYAEKARRNKDPEISRLVQVLKSRSFLFERRA